jgi:DNA-binding MarR family transcriptional regulator
VSRPKRRRASGSQAGRRFPLTADAPSLLVDGSDERLRRLVYDLFTISVRMQRLREGLAHRMNVTGPQYTVLMAVGELQGHAGVPVRDVANRLHVTGAHATVEIGKLVSRGLLSKATNPKDGRSVLVHLTSRGLELIDRMAPLLRATNDRFFGGLDRKEFLAAVVIAERLMIGSENALRWWKLLDETAVGGNGNAGPRNNRRREKASVTLRAADPMRRAPGDSSDDSARYRIR